MNSKISWKESAFFGIFPDIFLCGILSLVLEIILEVCDWRSIRLFLVFLENRTWVFGYNCLIIFLTLLPVFFVKRKLFVYIFVSSIWLVIGVTNGVMLGYRNTPFSAVDVSLIKSTLPIINNYMEPWQICAVGIGLIGLIVGLVCLFLYSPKVEKKRGLAGRFIFAITLIAVFAGSTIYGIEQGKLESRFSNIRLAYRTYGTPYCFGITLFDNGIDRPVGYSVNKVKNLMNTIDAKQDKLKKEQQKNPNIIFVQLESFFDVTRVKNLEFSQDPIPYFRSLMEEYTSGYVSMPTYGAGTVNTEFEVITGMNKDYFGAGEYPFKTILMENTSESICYILKKDGYAAHAIHNNNASFYDRDIVYANLGFDTFTTIEMMNVIEKTQTNWAKDKVLTDYINQALDSTQEQDFIYTVSVQPHGDYPEKPISTNTITVTGAKSESFNHQYSYYASQLKEVDDFLKELITSLEERKEDTVLVVFGDHLPSLEIETEHMTSGTKFQTEYFVWDNMGLDKEDEDLQAYRLYSKILKKLGNHNGVLNRYHQVCKGTDSYQSNLKLLQYDLLYGNNFAYGIRRPFERTEIRFGVKDVMLDSVMKAPDEKYTYIVGEGFTKFTDIYVNDKKIESEYMGGRLVGWEKGSLSQGDQVYIIQRSKTNQRPVLWKSPVYVYQDDGNIVLKESLEKEELRNK